MISRAISCYATNMRLVLDTDVLVAALRSPTGASRQLLIAALDRRFSLLASTSLWLEYEAVLTREEHLAATGLLAVDIRNILSALSEVAVPVNIRFRWRPTLSDPDDERVLEVALNGQAEALVTFNRRDFSRAVNSFNLGIVTPAEAWRKLELSK